jgi:polar amino acid transport system substrate-binding protein
MTKAIFSVLFLMAFAAPAIAQETIIGDAQSLSDVQSVVPKEYQKAFNELQTGAVDDLFYKMMQLGRGIQKDDRVAIIGKWQETNQEIIKTGLRVLLFQAENASTDLGSVLALFTQLPKLLEADYLEDMILLGKYQGAINGIPLISIEYALYTKQVLALSTQKLQPIGPETIQAITTSAVKNLIGLSKISVAVDATWPPMEMIDDSKKLVGFDIDLMKAIAKTSGFQLEFKNTAWDGIFAGLDDGKYDAIISSVTITDERSKTMSFSIPYINAGQVLVVPNDINGIVGLKDLISKVVGAQTGTTGEFEIEKVEDEYSLEKKTYDEIGLAIDDLANGRIDAVVCDLPSAAQYAIYNGKYKGMLKIVGHRMTEENYGVAIKKGNTKLLDLINKGLKKLIDSGEIMALEKKWLTKNTQ